MSEVPGVGVRDRFGGRLVLRRSTGFRWGRPRRWMLLVLGVFVVLGVFGAVTGRSRARSVVTTVPTSGGSRYVAADGLVVDCLSVVGGRSPAGPGLPSHGELVLSATVSVPATARHTVLYWVSSSGSPVGPPVYPPAGRSALMPPGASYGVLVPGVEAVDHQVRSWQVGPSCSPAS